MQKGRFITLEGAEGVGKSTNLNFIAELLESQDVPCVVTREPGGTPLAERIRTILLDKAESDMHAMTELLLMFAARKQHVESLIRPALAAGKWVICDRFTDSTYAYQGYGRELDLATIETLENLCLGSFRPDLTLVLDLPVGRGRDRVAARGEKDRFESESDKFFDKVREGFLQLATRHPRYRVVDASQPLETVQAAIAGIIAELGSGSHG
ncbi:MAG: dTMP kinase [Pseudomonadales bacterium]|nr:dTMP kinase [Pseudomonadales bacterium]